MSLTDYYNPGSKLLQGGARVASVRASPSEKVMADQIKIGTIFIEESTPLPNSLKFESEPYPNGWRSVKNLNGYEFDRSSAQWDGPCSTWLKSNRASLVLTERRPHAGH